jgi:hypothetical protein
MRTGDYEVYVSMVLLLRGFVGNVDILEERSETWEKAGLECGVDERREAGEGSVWEV